MTTHIPQLRRKINCDCRDRFILCHKKFYQKIEVLAGTNLPMIIEGASMMSAFDDPLELAETLIPTGKDYIVRFELVKHEDDADEDGI